MTGILAFLLKVLSGPLVDQVLDYMKARQALDANRDKLRADVEIETIRQAVQMQHVMAATETARYSHAFYWLFVGLFLVPLALWWLAVLMDSIFLFPWNVAALPAPLNEWAAMMIGWLFLAGGLRTVVGGRR